MSEVARLAFSVKEFLRQTGITSRMFYELQKRGEGPKLIRLGRRTYIAEETAREWLRQREACSQSLPLSGWDEVVEEIPHIPFPEDELLKGVRAMLP